MDLDDLQKPNIGKPEFATGRSTGERKMWAIVTTVAFAIFWFSGLFTAAGLFGQQIDALERAGSGGDRPRRRSLARRRVDAN
jgi:hypothetical protein